MTNPGSVGDGGQPCRSRPSASGDVDVVTATAAAIRPSAWWPARARSSRRRRTGCRVAARDSSIAPSTSAALCLAGGHMTCRRTAPTAQGRIVGCGHVADLRKQVVTSVSVRHRRRWTRMRPRASSAHIRARSRHRDSFGDRQRLGGVPQRGCRRAAAPRRQCQAVLEHDARLHNTGRVDRAGPSRRPASKCCAESGHSQDIIGDSRDSISATPAVIRQ